MIHMKRLALLFSLLVLALPALAVEDNLTIVGGDEAAMREFMEVYLQDMSPPETETTVYIGQLPQEMSVDLPASSYKVVGAIVREGPYPSTEIIYLATDSVDTVEGFYETELTQSGWERMGMGYGQRGFIAQEQAYADFCNADKDKYINVNIMSIDTQTRVRMNVNDVMDPYICNQPDMSEAQQNDPYLRLPELRAPEGVTMLMNRGGGGGGGGYPGTMYSANSTWLTSDVLSIDELMAAYNEQLVASGWEQMSSETGEHISLSLWTFTDDVSTWSGYFSLMENATVDGEYYATVMVEQVSE